MNLTERIETFILSNIAHPEKRKIGVEVECMFYNKKMKRLPVDLCEEFSASAFMEIMKKYQENDPIKASYSLEPGGQLEWASPPFISLHEIYHHLQIYFKRVRKVLNKQNLIHIDYALEPIYSPEDISLIDMEKYNLMHNRFVTSGRYGPWMMRNTTSIQINIDVSSRGDAEIMAFIADCLEPICAVLFANSPFMNSRPTGTENLRYRIWNDTDPVRCKNLLDHGIVSHNNLIKKYSEYLQDVPAIFVLNQEGEFKGFDGTLGEWLSNQEKSSVLQDRDIQVALHQIFTHVRFKHVLEVRGADGPPRGFELAPAAFWTGLLASENTKYEVLEIVKTWTIAERKHLNKAVSTINLDQEGPAGKTIKQWIKTFSSLSVKGLKERADFFGIESESKFIEPFVNDVLLKGPKSIQSQTAYKASGLSIVDFLQQEHQLKPPN